MISPMGGLGYVPFALLFPDREVALSPSGTVYRELAAQATARGEGVLALGDPAYRTFGPSDAVALHSGLRRSPVSRTAAGDARGGGGDRCRHDPRREGDRDPRATRRRGAGALAGGALRLPRPRGPPDRCSPRWPSRRARRTTVPHGPRGLPHADSRGPRRALRACETGKGKIYKAEGIVGLTRAFMFAGAPRVLCSLWKVDDEATRALMVAFYELWNPQDGSQGLGAAAALRRRRRTCEAQEKWTASRTTGRRGCCGGFASMTWRALLRPLAAALCLLLAWPAGAAADESVEPPLTVAAAADLVLQTLASGRGAARGSSRAGRAPDPWLVAEDSSSAASMRPPRRSRRTCQGRHTRRFLRTSCSAGPEDPTKRISRRSERWSLPTGRRSGRPCSPFQCARHRAWSMTRSRPFNGTSIERVLCGA